MAKWQDNTFTYNKGKREPFHRICTNLQNLTKEEFFKAIVVTWKLRRLSRLQEQVLHAITVCSTLQTSVEAEGSLFSTANGLKTQKEEDGRT